MNRQVRGFHALMISLSLTCGGCSVAMEQSQTRSVAPSTRLAVAGAATVVELAPVLLAARDLYPEVLTVQPGGIVSLFADSPVDIATNAETQALRTSVAHPDLRIIMTVAEGHYRVVARRSSGISAVGDLKGKRVATLTLSSAGYFLAKMLKTAGLSLDDVTVVQMNPLSKMVDAIGSRDVDAVVIWEPHSEKAARALGPDLIEFDGHGVYRELFNLNTTAGKLADPATRASIVQFLRAIIDATRDLRREPLDGQRLLAAHSGHALEDVRQSWKHHAFIAAFADDMLDILVEEETWLADQEGRQPRSRAQLARLIDRTAYEEALRQ